MKTRGSEEKTNIQGRVLERGREKYRKKGLKRKGWKLCRNLRRERKRKRKKFKTRTSLEKEQK